MLYKDMKYKDYVELLYTSFASTLALHNQTPEKISCFKNQQNSITFLVYKRGPHGYTTTKKLVTKTDDASRIETWLKTDFPDVDIVKTENEN